MTGIQHHGPKDIFDLITEANDIGLQVIIERDGQQYRVFFMREDADKQWADGTIGGIYNQVAEGTGLTLRLALIRTLSALRRG